MTSQQAVPLPSDTRDPEGAMFHGDYVASLAAVAPVAIFHTAPDGRVNYVTQRWEEIAGLSCHESRGYGWLQALHPDDRERVRAEWLRSVSAAREFVLDYRVTRPSGELRFVHVRAVPVVAADQHVEAYVGTVEDVTDRVLAESSRDHCVRRLEILAAIDRAILDANSPASIAQGVVAQIRRLFPAIRVSVVLLERETQTLCSLAVWSQNPTSLPQGLRVPIHDDVSGARAIQSSVILHGDLVDVSHQSRPDKLLYAEGVRSFMRVPMRTRSEVIGSLNISSARLGGFDETHAAVAQEVADRLAVAISNARVIEQLHATNARVAAMSQRLVEVQETERRDIARELHDEIGQVLTAVKLRLEMAAAGVLPPLVERLREIERLVDDVVATVRRLSLTLRPPLLDEFGLCCALSAHLERFSAQTGVAVTFNAADLERRRLPLDIETAAFRIVQESLTNVARHAGVQRAYVHLKLEHSGHLEIRVVDAGCGFDRSRVGAGTAGLTGMDDRVALLGGSLRVDSGVAGTAITARIPVRSDVFQ